MTHFCAVKCFGRSLQSSGGTLDGDTFALQCLKIAASLPDIGALDRTLHGAHVFLIFLGLMTLLMRMSISTTALLSIAHIQEM